MNIGDDNTQDQYKKKSISYFILFPVHCALMEWPSIRYDLNGLQ